MNVIRFLRNCYNTINSIRSGNNAISEVDTQVNQQFERIFKQSVVEGMLETAFPEPISFIVAAYLDYPISISTHPSIQLVFCRALYQAESLHHYPRGSAITKDLINPIIGYMASMQEERPESLYAQTLIEQLEQTVAREKKAIAERFYKDADEWMLYRAILKQVTHKLNTTTSYQEKFENIFYVLWDSAIQRPNGKAFLQKLLGDEYVSDVEKGLRMRLIPTSSYTEVMRWVWDDNLIAIASKIENAPKALDNQSHANQAQAIRTWLNNPVNVQSVTRLNVSRCSLTFLPPEIGNLIKLKILYVDNNKLRELPSEIGNLIELTCLNSSHNQLKELLSEIGKLIKLETLGVVNNKLREFPSEIGNCIMLTVLEINNNELSGFPPTIVKCTKLKYIHLGNNKLEEFPLKIFTYTSLKSCHLEGNPFQILDNFTHLKNIDDIYLSVSQLRDIPDEFYTFFRLSYLYLDNTVRFQKTERDNPLIEDSSYIVHEGVKIYRPFAR